MPQVARLNPLGFLAVGPKHKCHAATEADIPNAVAELLLKENAGRSDADPITEDDLYPTREVFDKTFCGPIDLSEAGVEDIATRVWDDVFTKQILAKAGAENLDKYKRVAHLIGAIYFAGDFVAETYNEHELEALLKELGVRYNSWEEVTEGGKSWA